MLGHALVALDRISISEIAIGWVRFILPGARLILGRVIESAYVQSGDCGLAYVPYSTKRVEKALKELSERLTPKPEVVIQDGFPAGRLREIALETGCDLIVLVTRGGSKARRRLFGGTVEHLLHESKIPLLVVPAACGIQRRKRLHKIVVPLDGRETSEKILPLVRSLARRHRATVVLVHCLKGERPAALRPSMNRLRSLAAGLRQDGVRAKSLIAKGDLLCSLGKVVEAEGADFMAMSVYGHGALSHLLFGAKASRIIQSATVPVLVVRHDAPGVVG